MQIFAIMRGHLAGGEFCYDKGTSDFTCVAKPGTADSLWWAHDVWHTRGEQVGGRCAILSPEMVARTRIESKY